MRFHKCEKCGEQCVRIRRRPVDRLQSVFLPVRRFRCMRCQYEVNVQRRVSAERKLALASAPLLAAFVGGALTIDDESFAGSHNTPASAVLDTANPPASAVLDTTNPRASAVSNTTNTPASAGLDTTASMWEYRADFSLSRDSEALPPQAQPILIDLRYNSAGGSSSK